MSIKKTVARNAALMMGSQIITWIMSLLLTIYMPRFLGPAAMGKFHFAGSIWAILSILATLGMDTYLTKEAARRPAEVPGMVFNSAVLRFFTFLICAAGLSIYLEVFPYPEDTRQVAYVVGLVSLVWLWISILQAILVGYERMEFVTVGNILGRIAATLVSIGLLLLGYKVVVIAAVNILGGLITLAAEYVPLSRQIHIPLRVSLLEMRRMASGGLPYLLSGLVLVVYMQFDFVIISLLVDDRALGWYGVADQLFGTLLFVPTVLMTVVFPVLSRMFITDADRLTRITRKSFDLLVLLSIPVGLGVMAAADPTISLLYGPQFAPSSPILALMGIVVLLTYLNVFIGQFLTSVDRQNQWTLVMAAAAAATLPLDLWLIPLCSRMFANGGLGGAISFIITEGGMLGAGLALMPKGTLGRSNLWLAARALLAGLLMLITASWFQALAVPDLARLALVIFSGAVVYLTAGFLLRIFAPEDISLAKEFGVSLVQKLTRKRLSSEKPL